MGKLQLPLPSSALSLLPTPVAPLHQALITPGGKGDPMSTTTLFPETTGKPLSGEDAPIIGNESEYIDAGDAPPLREEPFLVPPAQETLPGRALRPNEAPSCTLPLVLVHNVEQGKERVLPGYYACVGTMPCAATEYYLLVRWDHRESGRRGERRVVLPEHIRVIDQDTLLLPPPDSAFIIPATASGPPGALPEGLLHLTPESPGGIHTAGQLSNERYPQLPHSAKRKS